MSRGRVAGTRIRVGAGPSRTVLTLRLRGVSTQHGAARRRTENEPYLALRSFPIALFLEDGLPPPFLSSTETPSSHMTARRARVGTCCRKPRDSHAHGGREHVCTLGHGPCPPRSLVGSHQGAPSPVPGRDDARTRASHRCGKGDALARRLPALRGHGRPCLWPLRPARLSLSVHGPWRGARSCGHTQRRPFLGGSFGPDRSSTCPSKGPRSLLLWTMCICVHTTLMSARRSGSLPAVLACSEQRGCRRRGGLSPGEFFFSPSKEPGASSHQVHPTRPDFPLRFPIKPWALARAR